MILAATVVITATVPAERDLRAISEVLRAAAIVAGCSVPERALSANAQEAAVSIRVDPGKPAVIEVRCDSRGE